MLLLADAPQALPWYEIVVTSVLTLAARQGWTVRRYVYAVWDWAAKALKFARRIPGYADRVDAAVGRADAALSAILTLPELPPAVTAALAEVRAVAVEIRAVAAEVKALALQLTNPEPPEAAK